jgi:hypothetical protein
MKVILAVLCLVASLISARSVPILTVEFSQDEWKMDLVIFANDNGTPIGGSIYINDWWLGSSGSGRLELHGYFYQPFIPGWANNLQWGVNTVHFVPFVGDTLYGDSFTLVMPTSERPEEANGRIPDAGSTLALLLVGCACLLALHGFGLFPMAASSTKTLS